MGKSKGLGLGLNNSEPEFFGVISGGGVGLLLGFINSMVGVSWFPVVGKMGTGRGTSDSTWDIGELTRGFGWASEDKSLETLGLI